MTSDGSAVLGLSTRLLPGTLASKFQQAGEVGFDALCLDQAELEGGRPEDLAALIERFGVPVQALEAGFSLEDLCAGGVRLECGRQRGLARHRHLWAKRAEAPI